jgi:hypothetical protein
LRYDNQSTPTMSDLDNRFLLNQRFKEVFELLSERGEIVKSDRKKSKSAFAERLGTKVHIINEYLSDKRLIPYEKAKLLCAHFKVSELYMFQGIGEAFDAPATPIKGSEVRLRMALGINFSPNILFTNVSAFASDTVGVELLEENQKFFIPGIEGDLVAFYINGSSMSPTIAPGDMVICSPLNNDRELKNDEVYAVVSDQCVWVKRVQRCHDRNGRWTHLRLVSDNSAEHKPFVIELSEVRKILKVTRLVTALPLRK